jgi:hypothetical protein
MNTIAAKQLRSGMARSRPPYGGWGGAGSKARPGPTTRLAQVNPQASSWQGSCQTYPKGSETTSKSLVSLWEARSGLKMGPVAR